MPSVAKFMSRRQSLILILFASTVSTRAAGWDETPSNPAASDDPAEIIVTGERVQRSLKDTPSSVVVFTQKQLDAMAGADSLRDVLAGIPNVQLGNGSEGPAIRGQDTTGVLQAFPAFVGGTRPRASLQVDGRAVGYQEFVFGTAPLWDVRQIEVFRSPQTVAHGRNAIGGAIIVNTNDPAYAWSGAGRAIHGDLSTWQASAMATGPIVGNQLAFRATADLRSARPSSELGENMRGASPNSDRYGQLRLKLLAEPAALAGLRVLATFAHGQSRSPQAVTTIRPYRKRRDPTAFYGIYGIDVDSATLDARQSFGGKSEVSLLASAADTHARRFAPPGFGEARIHLRDFSLEPFVNWNPGGPLRFRGGVHLLRSTLDQHIDVTGIGLGIGTFHDEQQSLGVYGEVEVQASDRLTLTLGARYQRDRQHRVGGFVGPPVPPLDFDRTFSAFLPRFVAEYRISPGLKSGILVQKGHNPGGVTLDDFGGINTFEAEQLWDFEVFVKGDAARHLTLAGNIFYNLFRDAQRPLLVSHPGPDGHPITFTRFENAPRATSYGAEVEIDWRPLDRLRLSGGIGLLRTRLDKTLLPNDPKRGNEFGRAPRLTASAAIDWTPTAPLRLSAQIRHHSPYFSEDDNIRDWRIGNGTIVDARAAYSFRQVTAFAYARNLFNTFELIERDDVAAVAEDPREIGLGIEAAF